MNQQPLVSVVMTAWNRGPIIGESIASVLQQSYRNWELIIVDDGSTDSTCDIVETFKDDRIRLLRRPHLGIVASANFGVAQSRGTYIARLDSDDLSFPDRIGLQVAALERNPAAVLCFTDYELFGEVSPEAERGSRFVCDGGLIAIKMSFMCPLLHSSVMYRKSAFEPAGGYRPQTPVAEDYDLYTRLIRQGRFIGLPQKLVSYRVHKATATQDNLLMMKRLTKTIASSHLESFFKIKEAKAGRIYDEFHLPHRQRDLRLWFSFCAGVLAHGQCWRITPLVWLTSQTARIFLGK